MNGTPQLPLKGPQHVARLLIINYEYPPLGGGAGTATRETARALVRLGHDAAVITTQFRGQPVQEQDAGVQVFRVPARRSVQSTSTPAEMLSFLLSALRRAPAIARALRPHAVVCYFSIPSGVAGLWLNKRLGLRYVVSLRGGDVPGFLPGAMAATHKLTLPLTRLVWRGAAAVTANSENLRQLALRTMPGLDIPVIPNGVDTARFTPVADRQFGGAASTGLFVGRLNEQKGLDILIRTLGGMRGDLDPAFRMILVGGGPEEARLKELAAKHQVAGFLDFRGWVSPESIADAYRGADFFVLPSRDEGMPNVALEALACGLPVIMTDIPGSQALVREGENGWLVPRAPGGGPDPESLARTLKTMILAGPDTRRSMCAAARARAESFSWDATAHSLAALCMQEY